MERYVKTVLLPKMNTAEDVLLYIANTRPELSRDKAFDVQVEFITLAKLTLEKLADDEARRNIRRVI